MFSSFAPAQFGSGHGAPAASRPGEAGVSIHSGPAGGRITMVNLSVVPLVEAPRQPEPTAGARADLMPPNPDAPSGPPPAFEQTFLQQQHANALRLARMGPEAGDEAPIEPGAPDVSEGGAAEGGTARAAGEATPAPLLLLRTADRVEPTVDRRA